MMASKVPPSTPPPQSSATSSSSGATSASKTKESSSSRRSTHRSNASAPSEQELKEEEELQLALALSLSETPTKISFPDCHDLEQPLSTNNTNSTTNNNITTDSALNNNQANNLNDVSRQQSIPSTNTAIYSLPERSNSKLDKLADKLEMEQQINSTPAHSDQLPPIQERDQELFRFIGEIQSTLEIFNNRTYACKIRNRPVINDSALQSLFLKLNTEIQPKLSEYIKTYEDERAVCERLQDKLSQISDARAALDDLREEHQEKLRQEAAEAERERQSKLATKLELMRQKKSQMMQYQRELALQRIRDQEMGIVQQPIGQSYQSVPVEQQMAAEQLNQHGAQQQQVAPQMSTLPQVTQMPQHVQQHIPQQVPQQQQHQAVQMLPVVAPPVTALATPVTASQQQIIAELQEDAPLISFDD